MSNTGQTSPSAYGTTIGYYCMTNTMSLLTGVDCVADAIMVRITTGLCPYNADYGIDVDDLVGASVANPQTIIDQVVAEAQKDQRVSTVSASSSVEETTITLVLTITLTGGETFDIIGAASTLNTSAFNFTYASTQVSQ